MRFSRLVLLFWLVAATLGAAEAAKVKFTKSFPGSNPEYFGVTLERTGAGLYIEAEDDENPLSFQLTPAETEAIFALVEKLDRFKRPVEAKLKVASTGVKTFTFEDGAERSEVKFNYPNSSEARDLWEWFERISETERLFAGLERAAKFDRLGINKALLALEASYDRKRLVATTQFLPVLDRISKGSSYMRIARERARALAQMFRAHESQSSQH